MFVRVPNNPHGDDNRSYSIIDLMEVRYVHRNRYGNYIYVNGCQGEIGVDGHVCDIIEAFIHYNRGPTLEVSSIVTPEMVEKFKAIRNPATETVEDPNPAPAVVVANF